MSTLKRLAVLAPLVVAALLLARRAHGPLWLDEAWNLEDTLGGERLLFGGRSVRERGFELVLIGWTRLFGPSVVSLRLLMGAAFAGGGALVAWASRRARGDALTAVLLWASAPVLLHYACEINR